jgi:hypothetical protein
LLLREPNPLMGMWAILSDPGHADSFLHLGEAYGALREVVALLARRPYAEEVFAFKSMASFNLTTAATYQDSPAHDEIGIGYNPRRDLFVVGYSELVSPTRNPPRRTSACRTCEQAEVIEIIDRYVLRLLLTRRE